MPNTTEIERVTVVLADDHVIVREGFAALCAANNMDILGQASDGPSALELIGSLRPALAILDLHMPGLTGIEVIRRLRANGCASKLLILSISREDSAVMEALRAGADGYLLKDGPSRHLLEAIRFVNEGGVYVSPLLRGAGLARAERRTDDLMALLSPREIEVFTQLVNGARAKDIAERLEISPKTVDTYRASLMRKLNVNDLVGLMKFAIARNLTTTSAVR